MGWYDEEWQERVPITVYKDTGTSTAIDTTTTIPPSWDDFWSNIDSAGNDLLVTGPDGVTLIDYALSGFNATTRAGAILTDNSPADSQEGSLVLYWLYYRRVATGASNAASFTNTPAFNGQIDLGNPNRQIFNYSRPTPGSTTPAVRFQKTSIEREFFFVDLTGNLERRTVASAGSLAYEEPAYLYVTAEDQAGNDETSNVIAAAQTTFWEARTPNGRRTMLRIGIQSGTDGEELTIKPLLKTINPGETTPARLFEARFGLLIRDITEPAQ